MHASTNNTKKKIAVVGTGPAGVRVAEILGRAGKSVTLFGDEPGPGCDRVHLSNVLAGNAEPGDLNLHHAHWYAENNITLRPEVSVVGLDATDATLTLADGSRIKFANVVLATGSRAQTPDIAGINLEGVNVLRTVADLGRIESNIRPGAHALVVGGGVLGIEAAYGLYLRGLRVTLLHRGTRLMERQLGHRSSELVRAHITGPGLRVETNASVMQINGKQRLESVDLDDGRRVQADLVVVAIGVRARTELAESAGLKVNRGIVTGADMQTDAYGIYAIGECAETDDFVPSLVEPCLQQAEVCAANILGKPTHWHTACYPTVLKVPGLDVWSIGDPVATDTNVVQIHGQHQLLYRQIRHREGCVVSAVLLGDTSHSGWYRDLVDKRTDINGLEMNLPLGPQFCQT